MGARPRVAEERGAAISSALAECGGLLEALEERDVQYSVAERAVESLGLREASVLLVGVALVSYMLRKRGEDHWLSLAERCEEGGGARSLLKSFVEESDSLSLGRGARLRRIGLYLERFAPLLEERFLEYSRDLEAFRRDLARRLGAGRDSKTVVFATKMFYYALKAGGLGAALPATIPIPADYRVCLVSLTSGLVEYGRGAWRKRARELRSKYPEVVSEAWGLVCSGARIPPLKLDVLLWIFGGILDRSGMDLASAIAGLEGVLGRGLEEGERRLVAELGAAL